MRVWQLHANLLIFLPDPTTGSVRLLRHLGGMVRNAIVGRLALAGVLRRPAASQSGIGHTVVRKAQARPAPEQVLCARRLRSTPPAPSSQSSRPGWLARLLGRRLPVSVSREHVTHDRDTNVSPQQRPGLIPNARPFFNTPLEVSPGASVVSPVGLPEADASDLRHPAAIATATARGAPTPASLYRRFLHAWRAVLGSAQTIRYRIRLAFRQCGWLVRSPNSLPPRRMLQRLPQRHSFRAGHASRAAVPDLACL